MWKRNKVVQNKEKLMCGVCKKKEEKWFLSIDGVLEHFKINHLEYALGHFKTTQAHAHGIVRGVSKKKVLN